MSKYKIMVTETLQREIEVEADNFDKAIERVEEMYYDSEIILDSEDYVSVNFDNAQELEVDKSQITDFINFKDLEMALQEFDENGIRSEVGKWVVVRGAYDMQFEIHYECMTILQCIDNQLEWVYRPDYWDSETEKSLMDLVANMYGIKIQKTISTIEDLKQAIEDIGWDVYESDVFSNTKCWEISQFSPAGENFTFSIHHHSDVEEIIHEIDEYVSSFDIDEHVEMWIDAKKSGVKGIPSTSELVNDAKEIKEMLDGLSDYCNDLDIELVEENMDLGMNL